MYTLAKLCALSKKRERPALRLGHSPVVFLTETTIRHQDE